MKTLIIITLTALMLFGIVATSYADVHVRGYFRSNGTYVAPHYRSDRDGNFHNNWSTHPNVNPYTGKRGTRRTPSY